MYKSIIALLLLGSAGAFANEAADEQMNRSSFIGAQTRAAVRAELQQAQQEGVVGAHAEYADYLRQPSLGAGRSRSDVRAEAVQAARIRIIGELI